MKSLLLGSATSMLVVGLAFAQPPTAPSHATGPGAVSPQPGATTMQAVPAPGASATTGPSMGVANSATPGSMHSDKEKAAASGDRNQAVATTNANSNQPAKGANSFTEAEARRRIEAAGFSNVTGLAKDTEGVWRGKAQQKTGGPIDVWLDYKGNTGLKV